METIFTLDNAIVFITLTILELVLGIDNLIFISILSAKLQKNLQARARTVGLLLAMFVRIGLLFSITWVIGLTEPILNIFKQQLSWRDLILISGGMFLLAKSTIEIHEKLEGPKIKYIKKVYPSFSAVILQIVLLDLIFSIDSVLTAIGLSSTMWIMVSSIIIAVVCMMFVSNSINHFIDKHPSIKILALSFLLMIGMSLIGEGMHQHIPKEYIYSAMAFSIFVEMLNIKFRKKSSDPLHLHDSADIEK